jgi:pyrroline-5-carboxylate reductase
MSTDISQRIAFLGCGSMNEAIMAGLLSGGLEPDQVTATVRRKDRAAVLNEFYGIAALAAEENPEANLRAAEAADVVVLGVKPVGTVPLAAEIGPVLKPGALVLSVASAVTTAMIESVLNQGQPVVRTMPNTPARLGRGVISISAGTSAGAGEMDQARRILASAGTVLEVPEEQVDALSAISGSGPAYIFYLAEAMATAGEKLGLEPALARTLARETAAGAGFMLAEDGADPAALRRAVTSPNGTTEQAILTFDERDLPAIVAAGAQAAAQRAAAITRELGG